GALIPPARRNEFVPNSWKFDLAVGAVPVAFPVQPSQKSGMSTAAMPFCGVEALGCTSAGLSCPYAPVLLIVSCWKNTRPSEFAGTYVTLPTSRLCAVIVPETVIVLMSSGVNWLADVKAVPFLSTTFNVPGP